MLLPSGVPPVFTETKPPDWMMRSNALRFTTRSLIGGKAFARHGSIVIVSPSLKCRMCNWQVAVPRWPPCGMPLMTSEHMPQMPSRQSESNAIGSSPRSINPSLTTSSISRKDMSGRTFFASNVSNRPSVPGPFCRQTLRVRFIELPIADFRLPIEKPHARSPRSKSAIGNRQSSISLVAPRAHVHFLVYERFLVQLRRFVRSLIFPGADVSKLVVVAFRFAVGHLELGAEMSA